MRLDDHVIVGELAEVDARLLDLRLALRRDVLHQQVRASLGRDAAHRREHRAVAMREHEVAVHPRRLREAGALQLACGEHHRYLATADLVAVHVDVVERVVLAQRLERVERGQQRPVVPEAHRLGVGEVAPRFGRARCIGDVEERLVDVVETERRTRRSDVALEVGPLLVELIGLHDEVLHQAGVDAGDEDARRGPHHDRAAEHPERARDRVREARQRGDAHDDRKDGQRGQARVDARVRGAGEDGVLAEEKSPLVDDVAEGDEQQERAAEDREVRARRSRQRQRRPAGDAEVAARDRVGGHADDAT